MKRNKGYSLVELLVAVLVLLIVLAEVGALMVNSQTLYKSGFYEVDLQENAQQIVTQVQDLLMNATDSITYTTSGACGINSDVLTIKTVERIYDADGNPSGYNPVTYVIGRDVDLGIATAMKGDPGKEYATLYLQKGSSNIPIAEGVRALKYEDFHYTKQDMVTISLEMQNKEYNYSTSSEVYLRNQIGTGGPDMHMHSTVGGADVDLTILRVHEYHLTDYVPAGYTHFKFSDAGAGVATTFYSLSEDGELKCSVNTTWNETATALILASRDGSYSDALKITVHTDPVNDGNRMPLYVWSNQTADCMSVLPVTGICTCEECCNLPTMDAEITLNALGDVVTYGGWPVVGTTVHWDLCLYKNSGSNFTLKQEEDDAEHYRGTPYITGESPVNHWTNKIIQRSTSGTLNLASNCVWEFSGYKLKDGHDPKWDGLDPDGHAYLDLNYQKVGDYKWPTDGNAWSGEYTLSRIHTETTNAFAMNTTSHTTASEGYWNNIVDNDGYVRVHLYCTFKKGGIPESMIYDTYGYVYPQMTGSDGQHTTLFNIIRDTDPTDANPENPSASDPYGEYFDQPGGEVH